MDVGLKSILDEKVELYNHPSFIEKDPISIPHNYTKKQDIEITGFWTAMLAWGQRRTIIVKASELFGLMGDSPHEFMINHQESDRTRFENFKHRTFNYTDTLYFLDWMQRYYRKNESLEDAFLDSAGNCISVKESLSAFQHCFFDVDYAPQRTRKHISTPQRKSSCKRLNMFLRWMVREDKAGVDFGIWKRVKTQQLMMPLDIHVGRVSRLLGLLDRKQNDWIAVEKLTERMRVFDSMDPVKYDYALFGMGLGL
jgi:uncharacterized protein (TIGR02757 family)